MVKPNKKSNTKQDIADHFVSKGNEFIKPKSNTEVEQENEQSTVEPQEENELLQEEMEPEEVSYSDRLEKLKISDDKATTIIDDLCEKGSYMEKYIIRQSRGDKPEIKAVFSTRDSRSQGFIIDQVSQIKHITPIVYNKIMGELQLAASLVHFKGSNYEPLVSFTDDEEFEEEILRRVKHFATFPAPIIVVLINKLSTFDLEVASVMAPGYEDFF